MHLLEANNRVLFIKFRTVFGNFFNFILKWSNPILVLLFFLFTLVIHAQSQTTNNSYWEYVRTESGTFPYPAEGCYKPTTHNLKEGLIEISVKKCYDPNDKKEVRTILRFEWDKPPHIIYPGKPFEFKISTKLIENSNPDWVIGGSIWMRPEMETDEKYPFPGWAGGVSADYGKGKPQEVIIDDKPLGPPIWWGKNFKLMRLSYVVSHSDKYWWTYIYRLVEPSNSDIDIKSIPKIWNVLEKDESSGQYWKATWNIKQDGISFDGHWKVYPGGQEGDLPNFARIKSIKNNQIIIERPGLGIYQGTISPNRLNIKGTQSWCSTCIWEVTLDTPLPQELE